MKILMFAGSLRKDSWNKKLLHFVKELLLKTEPSSEIEFLDLGVMNIPVYNQDIETASGLPKDVQDLCQKIKSAGALIISTPEYNGTIPGGLKNIVDWVSRDKSGPWRKKPILLMAASPGKFGGMRALLHTRVPFELLGAFVYPDTFALPQVYEAFDAAGALKDEKQVETLELLTKNYLSYAGKII